MIARMKTTPLAPAALQQMKRPAHQAVPANPAPFAWDPAPAAALVVLSVPQCDALERLTRGQWVCPAQRPRNLTYPCLEWLRGIGYWTAGAASP